MRLFGREFQNAAPILAVLAMAAVAEVIATTIYQALVSFGKMWAHAGSVVVWSLVLVYVAAATVRSLGALGLAFSYLAAWLSSGLMYGLAAISLVEMKRRTEPDPRPVPAN